MLNQDGPHQSTAKPLPPQEALMDVFRRTLDHIERHVESLSTTDAEAQDLLKGLQLLELYLSKQVREHYTESSSGIHLKDSKKFTESLLRQLETELSAQA